MKAEPSPGRMFPDQTKSVNNQIEGDHVDITYRRYPHEGPIKEVEVHLYRLDRTPTRKEAIAVVNKVRSLYQGTPIGTELKKFMPKVVIVYPYKIGWDQGFCIWMTVDRGTNRIQRPFGDEITNNQVPRRRAYIIANKHWT